MGRCWQERAGPADLGPLPPQLEESSLQPTIVIERLHPSKRQSRLGDENQVASHRGKDAQEGAEAAFHAAFDSGQVRLGYASR